MLFSTHVLAFILLTAAPDAPIPTVSAQLWPQLQNDIKRWAVQWEIYDPREERFQRAADLANDLPVLRKRYRDLADAPSVYDTVRLPVLPLAVECLSFNRAYRRALEKRMLLEGDRATLLKEVIHETDELHKIWDAIRDARCEVYYVPVRRQALKRLRDLVGPEAFYSGQFPPHVPLWRFEDN
jgi:hypothetical protein